MFEEALGVGRATSYTEAVLMEASLKTTAARQEEGGSQGQACLSLGCLRGSVPSCKLPGGPSHVLYAEGPYPGSTKGLENTHPSQEGRHSLVPAAITSPMHTPKVQTNPHTVPLRTHTM